MYIILVNLFFYDILYYVTHVFLHKNIYSIHKLHHTKLHNKLTYLDAYNGHIVEKSIQFVSILTPYYVTRPNLYFFAIFCSIIIIRDLLKHDINYAWLVGNHHLIHHKYPKYNYGEYWIDTLGGTKYPKENEYIYGIIYV